MAQRKLTVLAALFAALIISAIAGSQATAALTCELFLNGRASSADPLLFADLLSLQRVEVHGKSRSEVKEMNAQVLERLSRAENTAGAPKLELLSQLLASVGKMSVIADQKRGKYDQCNVQIGFCFGRAAFFDIALRKLGVRKEHIRKAWAVGTFVDGELWQFHVATAVQASDGNWYAVDDLYEKPRPLAVWFQHWADLGTQGDLRLYVTDADKFSVSTGPYDRLQMGLDLVREADWYKGFYQDLFAWFDGAGGLASLGLKPIDR